ncbi:2-amino-4-hydroxy-6-hydroxymethyldihydropteridine diphosphokinase [Dichotomicrobium thermohalophilum]|nr:2-amino-4-hydroxy-6-hydroxymethyldihydropteridine diphosphokinase [Dichotomicrobium thermohalophilum]
MRIVLGLGANVNSVWGAPSQTIRHFLNLFGVNGICVEARSPLYESAPLGIQEQADFVNAVVVARTGMPPEALLRTLKQLEQTAGRRKTRRWGPRPLDIDILDYAGRVINWPGPFFQTLRHEARAQAGIHLSPAERTRARAALVAPHPQLHLRPFVLQPLMDVLPRWHHPVTGESVGQLLTGLPRVSAEGHIQRLLADAA